MYQLVYYFQQQRSNVQNVTRIN